MIVTALKQLEIFIPGKPAPQGSARGFVNKKTGRAIIVKDNDAKQKTWRGDIREQVMTAWDGKPPLDGPILATFNFVMPRPKTTPKRHTPPAIKRPDLDKLARAVCDALTSAGVYGDDAQITTLCCRKRLAALDEPSGCAIFIALERHGPAT